MLPMVYQHLEKLVRQRDCYSVYFRTGDCGIHTFFSEITHFFFQTNAWHSCIKLNDVHLLFDGKRLPSLKSDKSLFMQLSFFLNHIRVHCCQLKPIDSLKELLPFINTVDWTRCFIWHFYIIDLQKKSYIQIMYIWIKNVYAKINL